MALQFVLDKFAPTNNVKDDCGGLPWAAVIQPLVHLPNICKPAAVEIIAKNNNSASPADLSSSPSNPLLSNEILRCAHCYAYINPYCIFNSTNEWKCSLCRDFNRLPANAARYSEAGSRKSLPELQRTLIETEFVNDEEKIEVINSSINNTPLVLFDSLHWPVYLFAIDLSGSYESIELIKSSLLAAIESLNGNCYIGLITFHSQISLFNLSQSKPHCKSILIDNSTGQAQLPLSALFSLQQAIVQLDKYKENIAAAIESLSEEVSHSNNQSISEKQPTPQRCYGAALMSILEYCELYSNIRVLCFLSGIPNYGTGALDSDRYAHLNTSKQRESNDHLLLPATDFYSNLIKSFPRVCIDQYILSELKYCDLSSLQSLSNQTGGYFMLYEQLNDASLPQDLYRQLRQPAVFQVQQRIRTSNEWAVTQFYGQHVVHPQYNNLFLVNSCDPRRIYIAEFDFASNDGFNSFYNEAPVIQYVLAYTGMFVDELGNCEMRRKLRIHTRKLDVGRNVSELFENIQVELLISYLTVSSIYLARSKGLQSTRDLLSTWFTQLTAAYYNQASFILDPQNPNAKIPNPYKNRHRGTNKSAIQANTINTDLNSSLQSISRCVFALLKSELLSESTHPDKRVYLFHLFNGLEPNYLNKAVYPTLTAYIHEAEQPSATLFLNEDSLNNTQFNILVLDCYIGMYIYCRSAQLPAANSQLRQYIKKIKSSTPYITPNVVYFTDSADPQFRYFRSHLLENAENGRGGYSLQYFISIIQDEVVKLMSSN
jgi:hypothetical protein